MGLTRAQQKKFQFRVSLYRPTDIADYPDADSATDAAADISFIPTPAYVNVPCLFKSTPEVDLPEAEGLNKEANIFTLDLFSFDAQQEIANGWGVVITQVFSPTTPNLAGLVGGWWITQDNAKTNPSIGRIIMNQSDVFAKRGDKPAEIA